MQIFNRKTFLTMPEGTVFMKFGNGHETSGVARGGFGDLCIKAQTIGADFRYFSLDPSVNCVGGDAVIDKAEADQNLDVPIEIEHSCRDDDVQALDQKFAVWSAADVDALLNSLVRVNNPVQTRALELQEKAHLYEKLRKLNPRQFSDLYAKNISGQVPFDDLVRSIPD